MVAEQILDTALGLLLLVIPVALLVAALASILRLARAGELRKGLGYIVFLPGRRRQFVGLFVVMTTVFLSAVVVDGLVLLGTTNASVSDIAMAITTVGGAVALFVLMVQGLRPHRLSGIERVSIPRTPGALEGLGLIGALAKQPDED